MPFAYLRDPLFLGCVGLYFVNRLLFEPLWPGGWSQSYLNDLILIPFCVPIMLWGERKLGLRGHDGPPLGFEIILPLILWAAVFELILPALPLFRDRCTADPNDVLAYTLGALAAAAIWRRRYAPLYSATAEK